jgi:hypothetical protein
MEETSSDAEGSRTNLTGQVVFTASKILEAIFVTYKTRHIRIRSSNDSYEEGMPPKGGRSGVATCLP